MKIWWRRFLVLMAAYSGLRLLFLYFNWPLLSSLPTDDILFSFVVGLRFDLATVATINGPLFCLHFFRTVVANSIWRRIYDHVLGILFVVLNIPLISANVIDARLFAFTGRRMTPDFFKMTPDITQQGFKIAAQYWYITAFAVIGLIGFIIFSWQSDHTGSLRCSYPSLRACLKSPDSALLVVRKCSFTGSKLRFSFSSHLDSGFFKQALRCLLLLKKNLKTVFLGFLILCGMFLSIRGGVQRKPLAPAHAFLWQPPALSNLILNSGITLLRTPPSEAPPRIFDFSSWHEVRALLTPPKTDESYPKQKKNVIVIVVESLATEYVGFFNQGTGYTPFLDNLLKDSVTFRDSFANGRRSIDAMPVVFASIPAWRDQSFLTSSFSGNEIRGLPSILKTSGYQSAFFHGAANGSMHFDSFSAMAGFDQYLGMSDYPNKDDYDGTWGIFDEPFLAFAQTKINSMKRPFFVGIFTLSSHNPFSVPKQYQGKFPKGTLPIHESIGYADWSLRKFFESAKRQDWFRDTLFVITGDHTSLSNQSQYNNLLGRYRVPIVFYDPAGTLKASVSAKVASQVDILPSLVQLLGVVQNPPAVFGSSLFDGNTSGSFVQAEYDRWYEYNGSNIVSLDGTGQVRIYDPHDHEIKANELKETARLQKLRAARQYFYNGLLDNSWYR